MGAPLACAEGWKVMNELRSDFEGEVGGFYEREYR